MNYKEKYNKLVEAVKVLQEANPSDEGIQNWVNDNVPELRENEDERIRKEILEYFQQFENEKLRGVNISDWIDWLEKQGQKSAEWKQENREELTEFENAMMHIGNSFFGENAGLDPNDTATIKEQAELLLELAPKTEWSEEDETGWTNTMIMIKEAASNHYTKDSIKLVTTWLESIKQRIGG